jgi:hypothetical protein
MLKTSLFTAHVSLMVVIHGPVNYVAGMHHILGVSARARVF